jgi:hypothetical protein
MGKAMKNNSFYLFNPSGAAFGGQLVPRVTCRYAKALRSLQTIRPQARRILVNDRMLSMMLRFVLV